MVALSVNSGSSRVKEIDESTAAVLRFDGERIASFVTSFNADDVASYRIVGTKGHLHGMREYAEGLAYELTTNGKTTRRRIGKRDQFAPGCSTSPTASSSAAIRSRPASRGCRTSGSSRRSTNQRTPERSCRFPVQARERPTGRQRIIRPGIRKPDLVKVQSASED